SVKRYLIAVLRQSDSTTEEWNELLGESQPELVLVRTFEKERPLLRKEKWETSEVDLTCIHFCLCEVSVRRKYGDELRCDLPGESANCGTLPRVWTSMKMRSAAAGYVWTEFNAYSLAQFSHSTEFTGAA